MNEVTLRQLFSVVYSSESLRIGMLILLLVSTFYWFVLDMITSARSTAANYLRTEGFYSDTLTQELASVVRDCEKTAARLPHDIKQSLAHRYILLIIYKWLLYAGAGGIRIVWNEEERLNFSKRHGTHQSDMMSFLLAYEWEVSVLGVTYVAPARTLEIRKCCKNLVLKFIETPSVESEKVATPKKLASKATSTPKEDKGLTHFKDVSLPSVSPVSSHSKEVLQAVVEPMLSVSGEKGEVGEEVPLVGKNLQGNYEEQPLNEYRAIARFLWKGKSQIVYVFGTPDEVLVSLEAEEIGVRRGLDTSDIPLVAPQALRLIPGFKRQGFSENSMFSEDSSLGETFEIWRKNQNKILPPSENETIQDKSGVTLEKESKIEDLERLKGIASSVTGVNKDACNSNTKDPEIQNESKEASSGSNSYIRRVVSSTVAKQVKETLEVETEVMTVPDLKTSLRKTKTQVHMEKPKNYKKHRSPTTLLGRKAVDRIRASRWENEERSFTHGKDKYVMAKTYYDSRGNLISCGEKQTKERVLFLKNGMVKTYILTLGETRNEFFDKLKKFKQQK